MISRESSDSTAALVSEPTPARTCRRPACLDVLLLLLILGALATSIGFSVSCSDNVVAAGPTPIEVIRHFASKTAFNPQTDLSDPYAKYAGVNLTELAPPGALCAIRYAANRYQYTLQTFASVDALANSPNASDWHVTHLTPCGTCSTLQDLSVYLHAADLTAPVRRCSTMAGIKPLALDCLRDLGFTEACAYTWYYNAKNTARHCLAPCLKSWITNESYNKGDGELNECLQCDETKSGPIFKFAAGRTRRNSGIPSEIEREHGEIAHITHNYY